MATTESGTIKFEDIPDEYLKAMVNEFPGVNMSAPWQYDTGTVPNRGTDADGFSTSPSSDKDDDSLTREALQEHPLQEKPCKNNAG